MQAHDLPVQKQLLSAASVGKPGRAWQKIFESLPPKHRQIKGKMVNWKVRRSAVLAERKEDFLRTRTGAGHSCNDLAY